MGGLEQIRIVLDDGFADIDLPMSNLKLDGEFIQQVTGQGLNRNLTIGFQVRLGSTWERQELESGPIPTLYWGRAEVVSVGPESDGFLSLLDELYGTRLKPSKMRGSTPFLAVSLSGNPIYSQSGSLKMKLFFESEIEERVAEFFLNLDFQAQQVEFHEKDTDYRRGVVLALSADEHKSNDDLN